MQFRVEQAGNGWNELRTIQKSLNSYAQIHGRLPCPASLTLPPDDLAYGSPADDCSDSTPPAGITRVEHPASSGTFIRIGAVPVHGLGLAQEFITDPWGNQYFYAVTEANITALDTDNEGIITVQDGAGNTVMGAASYVIGTHGPSSKGATAQDTQTVVIACDASDLDGENCDFDDGLFYDAAFDEGDDPATFFDDYVLWGSRMGTLQQQASIVAYPPFDCLASGYDGPTSGATGTSDCWYTCASHTESTAYGNVSYSGTPTQDNSLSNCTFACSDMDAACSGGNVTDESSCSCGTYDCVANGWDGPVALQPDSSTCYYTCASYTESTSYGNVSYSGTPAQANSMDSCTFACTDMDPGCDPGQVTDESSCTNCPVTTCDLTLSFNFDNRSNQVAWDISQGGTSLDSGSYGWGLSTATETITVDAGQCYDFEVTDSGWNGLSWGFPEGDFSLTNSLAEVVHSDSGNYGGSSSKSFCLGSDCSLPFDCVALGYDGPLSGATGVGDCWYSCANHAESTNFGNVTYSGTPTQTDDLNNCTFDCNDMYAGCTSANVTDQYSCSCSCSAYVYYNLDDDAHEFSWAIRDGGTTLYSHNFMISEDNDISYTGPYSLSQGTTYTFELTGHDIMDGLDSSWDYIALTLGDYTNSSNRIADKNNRNSFATCTKSFTLDSICSPGSPWDDSMSCSGGEYDCIGNGYDGPASGASTSADCWYTCSSHTESTAYGDVSYSGSPATANSLSSCTFACRDMDSACDPAQVTNESSCSNCSPINLYCAPGCPESESMQVIRYTDQYHSTGSGIVEYKDCFTGSTRYGLSNGFYIYLGQNSIDSNCLIAKTNRSGTSITCTPDASWDILDAWVGGTIEATNSSYANCGSVGTFEGGSGFPIY